MIEKYKLPADIFDNAEILQYFENNDLPIHNMNGSDEKKML